MHLAREHLNFYFPRDTENLYIAIPGEKNQLCCLKVDGILILNTLVIIKKLPHLPTFQAESRQEVHRPGGL